MTLRPLSDNLVVKALDEKEPSASGIVLPDTVHKEKPERGEVIAIGPGRQLDNGQIAAMTVEVGQKIVFRKYSPDEIKVEGETYLVIRESDVLLII